MALDTSETKGLPHLVQGSEAPVFRGQIANNQCFLCKQCGHLLIDQYDPDDYVTIGIECFECNMVSWTPSLILGEVFSTQVINLGENGRFLIKSTVENKLGVTLTCDAEIAREISNTAPRDCDQSLALSNDGLEKLTQQYETLIDGKFLYQRRKIERLRNGGANDFPFAWSIAHLEKCLKEKLIDIRRADTITALTWLNIFQHVTSTWQHHPRFKLIARNLGMPKSFLHTSFQLIAAAYLYRAGNKIGISLEDKVGEPNPDLYIRMVDGKRKKFFWR